MIDLMAALKQSVADAKKRKAPAEAGREAAGTPRRQEVGEPRPNRLAWSAAGRSAAAGLSPVPVLMLDGRRADRLELRRERLLSILPW